MLGAIINLVLLILAIILFIGIWNAWGPVVLLINTLLALLAFKVLGWLGIRIEVSLWSLLIVFIGGLAGLIVLILLSVTGIAFRPKER